MSHPRLHLGRPGVGGEGRGGEGRGGEGRGGRGGGVVNRHWFIESGITSLTLQILTTLLRINCRRQGEREW